jgi:type II secretory pathway pseudopilin PulG
MNALDSLPNYPRQAPNNARAFTLTELLVVIGTIAVLAMVVLPALAGTMNKGGRTQCAANLRQNYVASMMYANEYRGWLPPCTVGAANSGGQINNLAFLDYTIYAYFGGFTHGPVPTNGPYSSFSNLGYLYRNGLAGNGLIFFCPDQWGTQYGASQYLPLLSANVEFSSGTWNVLTSYAFNPRILGANNAVQNIVRRYQKNSDLDPHSLFAVDFFGQASAGSNYIPHFREGGWNVLFTDGSVQFSRNNQAYSLIQNFVDMETASANEQADQIFNLLQLDH